MTLKKKDIKKARLALRNELQKIKDSLELAYDKFYLYGQQADNYLSSLEELAKDED